jgi:hypothetical protein
VRWTNEKKKPTNKQSGAAVSFEEDGQRSSPKFYLQSFQVGDANSLLSGGDRASRTQISVREPHTQNRFQFWATE